MPTLQELSKLYAKKQPQQVDQLLEEAPILAMLDFQESTHDFSNVYDEITEVTGASFVDFDGVLPTVGAESELRKVDLNVMGGQIEVGEDKAQMFGGPGKYFTSKLPAVLKQTGITTEKNILYNNLRQFAIDNKLYQDAGGATDNCYSIIAVRFSTGENNGLYSPKGFAAGTTLDAAPINGGNLYKDSAGKLVYGLRLKGYFGWQIASKRCVQVILNIKKDKIPTADQINQALLKIRKGPNTFLFMHPQVADYISKYKTDFIRYSTADTGISTEITRWNDVPIKTSFNFADGDEKKVTVS